MVTPTSSCVRRAFCAAAFGLVLALAAGRTRAAQATDFNEGWRFHLGDEAAAAQPAFDDTSWRALDVPHDWSIELGRDEHAPDGASAGYSRGGIGWYRKHFTLPAADAGRQVDVIFDGVQQDCEVWINGHALGLQPHGYIGFVHTLTPYLRPAGEENVLAVRAVNPENNTRWYAGSGLYRQVQLRVYGAVDVATWGLRLNTLWIHDHKAQLHLAAELRNATASPQALALRLRLHSPGGSTEDFDLGSVTVDAHGNEQVSQVFVVSAPALWSPDTPVLYTAELQLVQDGKAIGGLSQAFGIREISVSAAEGFRLNGQSLKLRGACLHHDNGLLGAAAFPTAEWRRVALMKANGFNAIRTSHNPPSSAFLDACDHLGVLVIDEFTDAWELPKKVNSYTRYFDDHWQHDLRSMIRRDYNHPSVVMWSIGNEIEERVRPSGLAIAKRLIGCIREIDPERPITNAICGFWDNPQLQGNWDSTAPAFALLDVGGYNYELAEYEPDHAKYPHRVMVGTESYPTEAYENWRAIDRLSYVIGDFVWTGMDHIGESGIGHTNLQPLNRPQPTSFLSPWPTWINWAGDIDLIGDKKPQSYYRDVVWNRSPVEIAVHRPMPPDTVEEVSGWGWPDELPSWTWPGQEGHSLSVRVFSKAARVRLVLNGTVIGEKPIDAGRGIVATFAVPYAAGRLEALALDASGNVLGTRVLETSGPAARVALTPEAVRTPASRQLLLYVPIEMRDASGRLADTAAIPVTAKIDGPAELVAFGSACPTDVSPLQDADATTFRGRALLILRSTGKPGDVHVAVSSGSLAAATATVRVP